MKHFSLFIIASFISTIIFAQSPQAISYQAIARNATGAELISQAVGIRISVHTGTATGSIEFSETHHDTTNQFGLFTLQIGNGTPFVGTFATIDWANGPKFLQVELDASGGTSYNDMGTSQLLSVPYALYAATGGTTYTAGTGIGFVGNVITNTAPDQTVTLTGIGQTSITGTYPNFTITTPSYSAGTGISISNNIITNTTPDQIVSVTGTGGTTVTGSYPNFTVNTPGSPSGIGMQVFSTVGTSTFTIPAGVTKIIVEVWGGGGDGVGGGGGAGGYGKDIFNVTPGTIYNVTVGAASGTSSFGNLINATGGNAGSGCCTGGEGGTSTALYNITGGVGEQYANAGFGFGGSAGQGGIGGKRMYNIDLNAGQAGGEPGGGGGGGTPGGAGGIGRVVVSW